MLADGQTAGRGRRRRSWVSLPGKGLYLSVLFRPPPGPPTRWTLGAAVAACDACHALGAETVTIKWPNDLLAGRDKLGGILVETRSAGGAVDELIVGLGVNVHHDDAEIKSIGVRGVTSLHRAVPSGMVGSRTELAGAFLKRMDEVATSLEGGNWSAVAAAWLDRAPRAHGAPVSVSGVDGATWSGVSAGLAEDGALVVEDAAGQLRPVRQIEAVRFTED